MAQLRDEADQGTVLDQFGFARAPGERRAPAPQEEDARSQRVLYWMFVVLVIGITFFQKIGYVPNRDLIIPLILPLAFAVFTFGILYAKPIFRTGRLLLYLAVMTCCAMSSALLAPYYSVGSLGLFAALYAPFVVSFRATRKTYYACMNFFSTLMLGFAVIVWLQHAIQFTMGWEYWPNLDKLLPQNILIPEFNYIQPIRYGMQYMKPSGIFFLEVSTLSQFITLALVIELMFFERMRRAVFLGATLFATFAGTGLFLFLAALPIIFLKMSTRAFIATLATIMIALVVAVQLNWFDLVINRIDEFEKAGSSANSRFIEPLYRMGTSLVNQSGVYSGIGAGQIESGGNTFWWPIAKVTVEYGLLEGILFYAFFLFCMLDRTPSRRFAFIITLWFSFEGTLLTAYNPIACVMFLTMFFIVGRSVRTRSGQPEAATA